jgi:predicted Zn-dependent protease
MHVFFEEQGESYFTATTAEYTDEVTISVQGAVDGAMNEMSNKAKGRIENRKDEERTINGHKANFTKATIARTEKDKMELQMVVLTKGQRIFQVMGLYRPDKDDIRKDVTRMIESIQLK